MELHKRDRASLKKIRREQQAVETLSNKMLAADLGGKLFYVYEKYRPGLFSENLLRFSYFLDRR
jgi:hypothetical protein